MPNQIELIKKYIDKLDDVYKLASLTGDLESDAATVREGNGTHTILIPKMSVDGLGDYSRQNGYADGSVSLEWVEKAFNYDRGRKFSVEVMDNEESAALPFGMLASNFIRERVAPEMDAWRFAKYAEYAGNTTSESITTAEELCKSIIAANNTMDEAEVSADGRYLYITPTLYNAIMAMDTYKSKMMFDGFAKITKVPQPRFYSAVDLLDGKADDELIGGYKKSAAAKNLNYLIIQKQAPIQFTKHRVNKTISPEANQTSDNWLFFYRAYGITEVYDNKKIGIYASVSET